MRIAILTVQVPFIRGGAEILAEGLRSALQADGHLAEIVAIPFKWYPPEKILDHMLACRLLDLTESNGTPIDRVIGLKFPAYLIHHSNKVLWLVHQHRTAYDLWDSDYGDLIRFPNGNDIRDAIIHADKKFIPESKAVYTISGNVSTRLKKFCGIDSTPLYNPPANADKFHCATPKSYYFFPSRLTTIKRQMIVMEALQLTKEPVVVYFAGRADTPSFEEHLKSLTKKYKIENRIKWLGNISEEEKIKLYAESDAVIYPPIDEDYGYVTLEAMLSAKAVITCKDSGGPLEFITHEKNGMVVGPTPQALADAMDTMWIGDWRV
jgi:glycosyltransferase involved in cell wall biosynthesis